MNALLHRAHDRLQSLLLPEPVGRLAAKMHSTEKVRDYLLALAIGVLLAAGLAAGWPGVGA